MCARCRKTVAGRGRRVPRVPAGSCWARAPGAGRQLPAAGASARCRLLGVGAGRRAPGASRRARALGAPGAGARHQTSVWRGPPRATGLHGQPGRRRPSAAGKSPSTGQPAWNLVHNNNSFSLPTSVFRKNRHMETILAAEMPGNPGDPVELPGPVEFLQLAIDCAGTMGILRDGSVHAAALMTTGQAVHLAAQVEAISRTVEYLQIVCAGALENHRVAGVFGSAASVLSGVPAVATDSAGMPGGPDGPGGPSACDSPAQHASAKAHVEFRTTADYMRCRLRISRGEAHRRLKLASVLLPAVGVSGEHLAPVLPVLADSAAAGEISSYAAATVADAVDQVRHRTDADTASAMEADLSAVARMQDHDFLVRTARRWVILSDQDGAEPSEEELRRFQGIFSGRKRNGLNHLNIFCTAEQHETLLTVMNAAAGPTSGMGTTDGAQAAPGSAQRADGNLPEAEVASRLDRRTRPQRLLGGLVDAAKAALAQGGIPASGGLRPQVLVTIDAPSLLKEFDYGSLVKCLDSGQAPSPVRCPRKTPGSMSGSYAFTGPVPAATVRKLACEADMLPVVLSGEGRILDIGRAQRLFPPHLRRALHARDGGCAFPGCTIPGPWTEAHHIRHWSRGGPTSTDNGVLLCSHHHHEVHKENWRINVRSGVPWFIPPAYVDPERAPLRNTFFRPFSHPEQETSDSGQAVFDDEL